MPIPIIVQGYSSGLVITQGYGTGSVVAPSIDLIYPPPGDIDVPRNANISFRVYSPNGVALSSLNVTINGEDAVLLGIAQTPNYHASFTPTHDPVLGSGYKVVIDPLNSLPPGAVIPMYVDVAEPVQSVMTTATWSFTTIRRIECFLGPAILLEQQILTPLKHFNALENVRVQLLQKVAVNEPDIPRARAVLQQAYLGDLKALLGNTLALPEGTLDVTVCGKRNTVDICTDMRAAELSIRRGFDELRAVGMYDSLVTLMVETYESGDPVNKLSAVAMSVILAAYIDAGLK